MGRESHRQDCYARGATSIPGRVEVANNHERGPEQQWGELALGEMLGLSRGVYTLTTRCRRSCARGFYTCISRPSPRHLDGNGRFGRLFVTLLIEH